MKQILLAISLLFLYYPTLQAESIENTTLCVHGWDETVQKNYSQALALYQECIATGNLTPSSLARTYRNIGITYRGDHQPQKAVEAYTKALELNPKDAWNDYVDRGNAWSDLNKFDKAFEDYDKAFALIPHFNHAYYNRGIVYERMGNLAKAHEDFISAYDYGLRSAQLLERLEMYGFFKKKN